MVLGPRSRWLGLAGVRGVAHPQRGGACLGQGRGEGRGEDDDPHQGRDQPASGEIALKAELHSVKGWRRAM